MLFILRSADAPWGDYGSSLWHGLAERRGGSPDLQIQRAGPFVPPVTFPWPSLVMSQPLFDGFRVQGFSGWEPRPAPIVKAVAIDWQTWDPNADEPQQYPASGGPENYILGRKHNVAVANAMPALTEIFVHERPGLQREGGVVDGSLYDGSDLCRGSVYGQIFVSERTAA